MSRFKTTLSFLGEIELDATLMPADPDVGYNHPYLDDIYIYQNGVEIPVADLDSITKEEWRRLERELMKHITEQAALARAYIRGQLDDY